MEAQALLTLGVAECAGGPVWIDDKEVLFSFGNGVVAQHVDKGSQRHVFGEANMDLGASSTDATIFATCPQEQVIAHAHSGLASAISIAPATTLRPYCTIKDPQQQHAPWVHLAFSQDGKHLASVGSYPEHVLEIWDLPEPPTPLKLGAKSDPPDPATVSARLVASATLGPRLAQLPPTFFPLNKSVLAVGGPEAVRLLFFDASVADNCIVRQSDVDLSALSEGHRITAMGWTPAGALMLGTSGGKVMLVPGAAPCGLADADWGTTPSCHKARSMFNSSVAARSKGWFDGLGNVMAVACLPGQQALAVVSPWAVGSRAKASNATENDRGGDSKVSMQQPHCAHLMWLDTSGPSTALAALAPLPLGSLSSAAVSPSLEHVLLRTVTGDVALADTTYTIPEQLPRLTKTGTLAVIRLAARNKTVRMNKEASAGSSSMSAARNRALQVVDEEDRNSAGTSTDRRPSDQGSPPSSVGSPPVSRGPSMTQLIPENGKSYKGSLPLTTAMAAVVNTRFLARYHAGRITGVVAFDEEVFATGGEDTTLRLWQCAHVSPAASLSSLPSEASTPSLAGSRPSSRLASRSSSPMPGFHLPPAPPRVPVLEASLVGMWRLHSPLTVLTRFADTPLVVAGTAGGEVHILHTQKLMDHHQRRDRTQGAEDAAKEEAEAHAVSAVWEQRPFSHGIAAMAFSSDGTFFAASSPDQNQVVLYRVVPIGSSLADITLQHLGFYEIFQPYLLSFSPKDLSAIERGRAGAPPLLVVGTTLGELQLLQMPQSLNHLRADDALIPPISLLHGLLRVQSPITAMLTMPIMTAGGYPDTTVLDGAFWLVACCADKSIKRIRMPQQQHCDTARSALSARAAAIEQQQRMGRAPPFSVPRVGMATSQNFQMPEIEKPMELDAPACHMSLSQTNRQLVVSCLSGTVAVFGFPDLIAHARWPLHATVPVQETALAQSLGSSRLPSPQQQHVRGGAAALTTSLLASVGPEGCVCMVSLEGSSLLGIVGATGKHQASKAPDTSAKPTPRPTSAAARRGFSVNGVPGLNSAVLGAGQARPASSTLPPIIARSADTMGVLGWKEAPLAARRKSKAASIEEAHEKLRVRKQDLARRLKELRVLNASQGEGKLGDHEFVVDVALEQELRKEADEVVAKAKTQAMVDIEVPEVMYNRILAFTKRSTEEQEQQLVSLPEYRFISVLSADDTKRWKDAGSVVKVPGVSSYSIKRLSVDEADKLDKVAFLRRVEQEEWQQRPLHQRGCACVLMRLKGSIDGKPSQSEAEKPKANGNHADSQSQDNKSNLTGADKEDEFGGNGGDTDRGGSGLPTDTRPLQHEGSQTLSATHASEAGDLSARDRETVDASEILGCEVFNGACHLLYSDLQLHAPSRKASQAIFLQEEIRCLQREFNSQFARLRTLKQQELERLNDKGKRIETIQNSLKAVAANAAKASKFIKAESKSSPAVAPPATSSGNNSAEAQIEYNWDVHEHWENLLHVADEEVPVDRFASPEMRAMQRARQAEAEEHRRRLEADDSKQRALRDMMNSTLEFRKKDADAEDLLKYEPWMDLPRASLSTEQRKLMAELEKRAMELMEECEKATRQLEMERKTVEADIYGHIVEFNAKVAALFAARLKADSQLRVFELQSIDLVQAIEELRASSKARDQVSRMDKQLVRRRNLRTALLTDAQAVAKKAALEYEAIQAQERALDRAMRREFTSVDEDLRDEAVALYRDRRHALSGAPIRPASEILAQLAEGATLPGQSRPGTSGPHNHARDHAAGVKRNTSSKSQHAGRRFGGHRASESEAAVAVKAGPTPAQPDNELPEPTPVPELARWQALLRASKRPQAHGQGTGGLSASQLEALNTTSGGYSNGSKLSRAGSVRAPGSVRAFGSARGAGSVAALSRMEMDMAVDWELLEHSVEGIMAELQATLASHAKQQAPYQRLLALLHTVNSRGLGPAAQQLAAGGSIQGLLSEAPGSLGLSGGLLTAASQKQPGLLQTEQPRRTSSPGDGSRGHQLRQEQAAERLLRQSSVREDAQINDHPFASPLARTLFDPSSAPVATTAAEMQGVEEPLSLPPFSAADKPADLEYTWWHRLQEFRDSRIVLEQAGDAAWHRLLMATYQLERLEHEEQRLNTDLETITESKVSLQIASVEAATDVLLQYRLQNGQVELPSVSAVLASGTHRGKPPSAMYVIQGITASDALFLHRQSVVHVNTGVLNEGQKKVAALYDIKRTNTAIHLARWEVSRSEVRGRHAAAELSHIQLMHVTKDLQAVLRNPMAMSRLDQETQLLALAEAAHASHEARKALKSRAVQNLTARIANNIEVQEELNAAQAAVEVDVADGTAIAEVIARSRVEEESAHRRALRSIVTNVQLKDIASAQAQELAALHAQLDVFQARTYPNINRAASAANAPFGSLAPDVRIPHLSPGGVRSRPASVPVGFNRPLWSAGSSRGAALSGAAPVPTSSRPKLAPRPYTTLGAARRNKQV